MLKKTIKYKDLDGNDVEDDFYFNLSKAEIAELELSVKGGLESLLQQLIKAEDGGEIIGLFKQIISTSIGKRSDDGKRFIKNQEIRDEFFQSDAYSTFFMELLEDPTQQKGAAFIRGIVPADLASDMPALNAVTDIQPVSANLPDWIKEGRVPTAEEFAAATPEQKQEAFRRKTS